MSRNLSLTFREALFAQESGEVPVFLLTIAHDALDQAIRLSSDATVRLSPVEWETEQSDWAAADPETTLVADQETAPSGSSATQVVESANFSYFYAYFNAVSDVPSATYTLTATVKKNGRDLTIGMWDPLGSQEAGEVDVSLDDGSLLDTRGGWPATVTTVDLGGGWWQVTVTVAVVITPGNVVQSYLQTFGNAHTGDGVSGFFFADAVLERPGELAYGTVSRGNVFDYLPMSVSLPDEKEKLAPSCQLVISNITRGLIPLARALVTPPPTVRMEVVLASDPDTVEFELPMLNMSNVEYNASDLSFQLTMDQLATEPFPADSFGPANFPGLF